MKYKMNLFLMILIFLLMINFSMNLILFNNSKILTSLEIECGIFSYSNKNSSSMYYMLFLIVFLIFDLEIILFMCILDKINMMFMLMFMLMIMLTLILELHECSLKWND